MCHLICIKKAVHEFSGMSMYGWSPLDMAPKQMTHFYCNERYRICLRILIMVFVLFRVFRGSADTLGFEDFIDEFFYTILEGCRSGSLSWSWIMYPFTTCNGFHRCVLMLE